MPIDLTETVIKLVYAEDQGLPGPPGPAGPQGLPGSHLSQAHDVLLTTPAQYDILQYDGAKWVNTTLGWDDERFPATGINPAGAIADPAVDTTETGFPGTLLFSGSADNLVVLSTQLPHSAQIGSPLYPHIHWSNPVGTANAVDWQLYYRVIGNPGAVAGAWVGPVSGTLAIGDPTVSDNHCVTSFGTIPTVGMQASAMILFRLYRRGLTDSSSGTARLYEFDYHYKKSRFGTPTEFA